MTGQPLSPRPFARRLAALRGGTAMTAALLFSGLATAALTAGLPAAARAQGFNGTVSSSSNVSINAGNTDVTVFAQEAVINWNAAAATAADTNVDFLPAGGSVLFHDVAGSTSGSFTVLNRINPTYTDVATGTTTGLAATISLSGTVNSTISVPDPATGGFNTVQGGNIWFYSPYGIIANGTSAFNVGSLLLTTSDIDTSNGGSLYLASPPGSQRIGFLQATQPGSFVRIRPGAQINAAGDPTVVNSAYVGVFAPRIEQGGTIASDGMTALVAGEAGTITFNLGLIDVAVSTGTTDANGIVHSGTTGGPASTGEAQTIALVAIPQNAAMTMLLSGSIGYTPAVSASPDGSAVVLNAGYDPLLPAATLAAGYGNIGIANVDFSNQLDAIATGTIDVAATAAGLTRFGGTTALSAGQQISLTANADQEIRADGALFLSSLLPNQAADVTLTVTAGTAPAASGRIAVADFLSINAGGNPLFAPPSASTGTSNTGGTVTVNVARGTLSATNGLSIDASAAGEGGIDFGGAGTGGTIAITVTDNGTISTGNFFASASGFGGSGDGNPSGPVSGTGGAGTGGTIILSDGDSTNGFGTLALASPDFNAQGFGGSGASVSGSGFGGAIAIRLGSAQNWGSLTAEASANNGGLQQVTTGLGDAIGQQVDPFGLAAAGITLDISGSGALTVGSVSLRNNAYLQAGSAAAHAGQAGGVAVRVNNGGALTVTGALRLNADATTPQDSGVGNVPVAPTMQGGNALIFADAGGIVTLGEMHITANALGYGASVTGGAAVGGVAQVGARAGSLISLTGAAVNTVLAEAYGAVGPARGSATGGSALVFAWDAAIEDAGTASLLISGSARSGGVNHQGSPAGLGFDATGREAYLVLVAGTTSRVAINTIDLRAQGNATVELAPDSRFGPLSYTSADILPIQGDGGAGTGGLAEFRVFGGTLAAGSLSARANGIGGSSGFNGPGLAAFVSGSGTGGQASLAQTAGTITAATIDLSAAGHGGGFDAVDGNGGVMPVAGSGFGGIARVTLDGGAMTLTGALVLDGGAIGGAGSGTTDTSITGGDGGAADASGGIAEVLMSAGSTALLTAPAITVRAGALGGAGGLSGNVSVTGTSGNGGAATGGAARLALADGGISVSGTTSVLADAVGGAGNAGGNAAAGSAGFKLADTVAAPSTTRALGPLLLSAVPTGGTGTPPGANGTTTAGTTDFTAQAGRLASALTITGDFTATAPGTAAPAGDGFTGEFGAILVTITGNALIATPRDVTMTVAGGGGANIGGTLTIAGRTVTGTGAGTLSAGGNVAVNAATSIALTGLSSGGTTDLLAGSGAITVSELASVGAVTAAGSAITLGSTSAQPLLVTLATASTGAIAITNPGNLTIGSASAGGGLSLTSTGGFVRNTGALTGTGMTLNALTDVLVDGALNNPTGPLNVAAGGAFVASIPLIQAGAIDIAAAQGITASQLNSLGAMQLTATGGAIGGPAGTALLLAAGGSIDLLGQSIAVTATGPLTVNTAQATAGALSLVSTGGALTVGSASATGNLALTAGGGNLTLTSGSAGGTTVLSAPLGAISATLAQAGGLVDAQALAVTVNSPALLQFGTANATAGDFNAGSLTGLTFGGVDAAGAFNATTGGLFTLNGTAGAASIAVGAGDIQLGAGSQLGIRGRTGTITLTDLAGAGTFIGGPTPTTSPAAGWRLDAAEAARLFADQSIQIAVNQPASGGAAGDVTIGSISLSYGPAATSAGPSPNLGSGGSVGVTTPGRIAVTGAVALNSGSASDLFSLSAGTIDLIGDSGSIALLDANGGLSGRLNLSAAAIRAQTAAAFAATAGGGLGAISARLDQSDGVALPGGYFQADAITVGVGSTFLIQNTGASTLITDRRGFTANSLAISAQSGADIAINGVLRDPQGVLITGLDTQESVLVNGVAAPAAVGAYSPLSTINGCAIGRDCSIPIVVIAPSGPIIEVLPIPPVGGGPDALLNLPIIQFGAPPLLDSPPLIDEPVTGVGNDDLWQRRCGADTDCHG